MHNSEDSSNVRRPSAAYASLLIGSILAMIAGAFWLSTAAIDERSRLTGFALLTAGFVVVVVALLIWRSKRKRKQVDLSLDLENDLSRRDADPQRALAELDEASVLFAGALKLADAFRLISHRVNDVVPFRAIALHTLNDRRTRMAPAQADGVAVEAIDESLANQSHGTGRVEIDSYLEMDSAQTFASSAAIPLRSDGMVFAVLQLFFGEDHDAASVDKYLFEAVGERVSAFVLSSISYERSHANALTDVTTDLPNERAFYLMLEKQIVESHNGGDGPLTVLAIDIKDFEQINAKYGHAIGDKLLNFVARVAKDNLRQMDFLARSVNDEFLAILPTASAEISQKIVERIHTAFATRKFDAIDNDPITVELNIGWATYENEGNTPAELLSFAEMKKEQQKMPLGSNVLAFRQELVG
ncbi:MAG: diguanylate cyclase domain-containing protein [Pyrinomonadaceae bacterium]